ncbi:acyltransferase [Trinickia dabaoshanensis]|uniref:Acyltransferase n=1 Tax=Trinickia dabaoshanensis TaxID=564714 RepID=A0A2N7VN71_9BURK|nr:acyltransferase [Trinickia dabaoshanensis]
MPAFGRDGRNAGLDALRAFTTLLVVFHHCAITYGAIGGWYYHEIAPARTVESIALILFCTVNQAFFMGLFFLLAGYYTLPSLAAKGPVRFLAERFARLGLPLLFYGWVLGPATIALERTRGGASFGATFKELLIGGTFDSGPMWFAQALLIFTTLLTVGLAFGLWRRRDWRFTLHAMSFPTNSMLAGAALVTGGAALLLRIKWPVGVNVWGLQLGYFASYVVLFAAGFVAANSRLLECLPEKETTLWWRIALLTMPLLPLAYFIPGLPTRWHRVWTEAVYALWEPFVAWGVIMFLLQHFQRRYTKLHAFGQRLTKRAYTIYIVHPPVLVGIALLWKDVHVDQLIKFAVTGSLSCVVCYLIAGAILRIPGTKRIL